MVTAMIIIFVIGYVLIALEHPLHMNKATFALITCGILWSIYAIFGHDPEMHEAIVVQLGDACEIVVFLIGAMTIVEIIDRYGGFSFITEHINAKSKKALRGGYYMHLEPGHCLLAVGNYWLPTNILTSCRNEMMANTAEWLRCVENDEFLKYYGSDKPGSTKEPTNIDSWDQPQGFGLSKLKTCPSGFPKDWPHVNYLRLKDYCCWHAVSETFFEGDGWLDEMERMFRAAKPMMDFMNGVIDDYE